MIHVNRITVLLSAIFTTSCSGSVTFFGTNGHLGDICDPSARNESHVGSIQVEKMGNMHDMG